MTNLARRTTSDIVNQLREEDAAIVTAEVASDNASDREFAPALDIIALAMTAGGTNTGAPGALEAVGNQLTIIRHLLREAEAMLAGMRGRRVGEQELADARELVMLAGKAAEGTAAHSRAAAAWFRERQAQGLTD